MADGHATTDSPPGAERSLTRAWTALFRGSRYRREAVTSSLSSVLSFAVGVVTGPVLARAVGPAGRGEIAAVVQPTWLLAWLLCFGLPLSAAYWVDEVPEGRLLGTSAMFGLLVSTPICIALWFVVPAYLRDQSDAAIIWARLFLVVLPLSAGVNTALEVRRRRGADARWNVWRTAPLWVSAVAIIALAIAQRLTVATALASYFLASQVPVVFFLLRLSSLRERRPSLPVLRTMLPFAWRSAATTGANSVTGRFDQVVLAAAVPSRQLGLYAVAVTTASLTNTLTAGLPLALFGHQRAEKEEGRRRLRYRRSLGVTVLLSSTAALLLGILAPLVLGFAFGARFRDAATPLRILLPGAVAFDVLILMSSRLSAEGRVAEVTRASVIGAVVTLAGLAAVVPRFGITGAAAVTSLAFASQVAYLVASDRTRVGFSSAGEALLEAGAPDEPPWETP